MFSSLTSQFLIEQCRRTSSIRQFVISSSSQNWQPPTPCREESRPPNIETCNNNINTVRATTSEQALPTEVNSSSSANGATCNHSHQQQRHSRLARDSCSCSRKAGKLGKHPIHIKSTMRAATGGGGGGGGAALISLALLQLLAIVSTSGRAQPDVGQQLDGHQVLRELGSRLIQQLANLPDLGDRWTRLPSNGGGVQGNLEATAQVVTSPSLSSIPQPVVWWRRGLNRLGGQGGGAPIRRQSPLNTALARLQSRIGARNSIRVHNAFRDLAWRLLASLSMPTPIIYEIRRQHLYSPEEDEHNDLLHNRNTSKTIRTKRGLLLEPAAKTTTAVADKLNPQLASKRTPNGLLRVQEAGRRVTQTTTSRDDDEDEPDNIRDRLRSRVQDLVNLSQRTLFGRTVRFPSFLPFKRQVQAVELPRHRGTGRRTRRARLLRRRSRRKESSDRQMISINGKQYYVNDDGELKEWNKQQQDDKTE